MVAAAVFGFVLGLYTVVGYFWNIQRRVKLILGSLLSFVTIVPATISLVWALHELSVHPFSKLKYISLGLAKYFLAGAFQAVIDYAAVRESQEGGDPFLRLIRKILYSDPVTRSYKRIYYGYAHVIDCEGAGIHGGRGDMVTGRPMYVEGTYSEAVAIGGRRLCLVDMLKIHDRDWFHSKWRVPATHCLYLDMGVYEKHKIFNNPDAVEEARKIISCWSANPEKPLLKSFDKSSMKAECPSLYELYCAMDDDIVNKHKIEEVGGYVHIG